MYQIANIIYVYLLIIILLILFNIWYVLKEKLVNVLNLRKKDKYIKWINEDIKNMDKKDFKYKKVFRRKLVKTNNLIVFESVVKELRKQPKVDEYILEISSIFQELALVYQKKDSIHKAYFSHMLLSLPKITKDTDVLSQTILSFTTDKSIYCRENAMIFLYQNKSSELIIEALKNISKRNLYYNSKLLADDLLTFNGDTKKLCSLLLSEFDEFSVNIQVAIINYFRFIGEDIKEDMYKKYKSHTYDKEVQLAMIRYFSKCSYSPMIDELINLLNDKDEKNYEYRLVAASILYSYDVEKVRNSLISCLTDSNWYVRKNAATSLSKMKLTKEEVETLKNMNDSYAKEMLQYIWENKKMSNSLK